MSLCGPQVRRLVPDFGATNALLKGPEQGEYLPPASVEITISHEHRGRGHSTDDIWRWIIFMYFDNTGKW